MCCCCCYCAHRYGLGQLYMKQEKYVEALAQFQMAAKINTASSVLRCCCGSALRKMNQLPEALKQLKVCTLDCQGSHAQETAGVAA